jgi:glycosyltransferase involved in cell wall biosynthesis
MGGEVDVVHAFSFHAPVAMAVNNVTEAPFFFSPVFHSSGHSTLANAAHVLYRPLAKRVFNRADSVLCLSQAERKEVIKLYPFCEDWARVVPLAVDEARFTGLAPFDVDVPVILSAGRLDSYKRVDLVIDAMQVVGESAKLVICGAGPDEQRLRNLISERGVERVVDFVGAVSDEDLRRWQLTATVTVSLSTHESFGLSLAEAVVAGSAIVASDIPAHREMADVMGGAPRFLPESADAAEVASALTGALRAGRPIRGARAHREWADVARDTIAIYEGAISHPRGGQ